MEHNNKGPYDCSGENPIFVETKEEKLERLSRKLLGLIEASNKEEYNDGVL